MQRQIGIPLRFHFIVEATRLATHARQMMMWLFLQCVLERLSGISLPALSAEQFHFIEGAQHLAPHVWQAARCAPLQFQDVLAHLLVTYLAARSVEQFLFIEEGQCLALHAWQVAMSVSPQGVQQHLSVICPVLQAIVDRMVSIGLVLYGITYLPSRLIP